MDAHNSFPICQNDLAQKIGRPVDVIRALRDAHLKSGEDWQIDSHNRVAYTVAAAEKLAVLAADAAPAVAAVAVASLSSPEAVLVVARKFPNPRIFDATTDVEPKKTVRVRCRDSRLRRVGERIKARELPSGLWEYVGVVRTFRQGAAR